MKGENIIDSRDLIEHFDTLKDDFITEYNDIVNETNERNDNEELTEIEEWGEADIEDETFHTIKTDHEELEELNEFIEELEDYGDFKYGATLINEDYFKIYCEEFCEDIGAIPKDAPSFITSNIDWDGVADDLRMDYTEATWGDETYLMSA